MVKTRSDKKIPASTAAAVDADSILREAFAEVAREYGYEGVDAEFVAFKEFKVRWQRSYRWASFKVSDYMMDAPKNVMAGLARTIFERIAGNDEPYPDDFTVWAKSVGFAQRNRSAYLRRARGLTRSPEGTVKNLDESMARLVGMGLAEEDPDLVLTWTKESIQRKAGYCSVLMKVIAISSVFDTDKIPESVLDYVLYCKYLYLTKGRGAFGSPGQPAISPEVEEFPQAREAQDWLARLCLTVEG